MTKTNNVKDELESTEIESTTDYVHFKQIFISNLNAIESELMVSKSQIAQICGVSRPTVSQWFSGACWPRMICVYRLAQAINCDVSNFFKEDGIHVQGIRPSEPFNYERNKKQAAFIAEVAEQAGSNIALGQLTDVELSIIANYRLLDEKGRDIILHILTLESRYGHDKQMQHLRKAYPLKSGRPSSTPTINHQVPELPESAKTNK